MVCSEEENITNIRAPPLWIFYKKMEKHQSPPLQVKENCYQTALQPLLKMLEDLSLSKVFCNVEYTVSGKILQYF